MTKCILNCLKISKSEEAQQGSNSMDNKFLYTAKFTHHDLKFHKDWWKSDKFFFFDLVTLTYDLENQ
jgi:hypothetical protein